ncbi:MAG: hypothetical protein QM784_23320 [Polyangiaceae bacterium]
MTASRWLVGFVVVAVFGSAAIDAGHPSVPTAEARPAETEVPGYCANETNSKGSNLDSARGVNTEITKDDGSLGCPADMVEVEGDHCQVVEQICEEYISEKKDRCAKYRNKVRCLGKTKFTALLHRSVRVPQSGRNETNGRGQLQRSLGSLRLGR